MASYPPNQELPPLGAICLNYADGDIHRPPGDPLNAGSFACPLVWETVQSATVTTVVQTGTFSDDYLEDFVEACRKLAKKGAVGVITSCGFLAQVQGRLNEKSPIPVATSSLIQLPFVMSLLPPSKHVGVITYEGHVLGDVHFKGVGVTDEMIKRITVIGSYEDGPLHKIIRDGGQYIKEELEEEMVSLTKDLLKKDPKIGAIVLECTQMPPYAKAIQKEAKMPVYDAITMIDWFYSGLKCRQIPEDPDKEDGLKLRNRKDKKMYGI